MAEILYRRFSPFQIAGIYFVGAALVLIFFELVLPLTALDPATVRQLQGIESAIETGVSALLIYGLTYSSQNAIEATNDDLEDANQVLEVLFRLIRHNLRNDMNVIRGYASMLEPLATTDQEREAIERVQESATAISAYSQKAGWIQQLVGDETKQVVINLSEETRVIAAKFKEVYPTATITVDGDDRALVKANSLLHQAIKELIENAILHSETDEPRVEITIDDGPEMVTIAVMDNGPGIPEIERATLERGTETPMLHSSGLGLWQVYWTVKESDGTVEIDERASGGTIITVSLPAADERPTQRVMDLQRYLVSDQQPRVDPRDPSSVDKWGMPSGPMDSDSRLY